MKWHILCFWGKNTEKYEIGSNSQFICAIDTSTATALHLIIHTPRCWFSVMLILCHCFCPIGTERGWNAYSQFQDLDTNEPQENSVLECIKWSLFICKMKYACVLLHLSFKTHLACVLVSCCQCRSCTVIMKSTTEKELNLQNKAWIKMTGYRTAENRFIDKTGLVSQYTATKVIFLPVRIILRVDCHFEGWLPTQAKQSPNFPYQRGHKNHSPWSLSTTKQKCQESSKPGFSLSLRQYPIFSNFLPFVC